MQGIWKDDFLRYLFTLHLPPSPPSPSISLHLLHLPPSPPSPSLPIPPPPSLSLALPRSPPIPHSINLNSTERARCEFAECIETVYNFKEGIDKSKFRIIAGWNISNNPKFESLMYPNKQKTIIIITLIIKDIRTDLKSSKTSQTSESTWELLYLPTSFSFFRSRSFLNG
jgi:hypothetical protein